MDRERKMNGDGKMEEVGEWMGGWGWMGVDELIWIDEQTYNYSQ